MKIKLLAGFGIWCLMIQVGMATASDSTRPVASTRSATWGPESQCVARYLPFDFRRHILNKRSNEYLLWPGYCYGFTALSMTAYLYNVDLYQLTPVFNEQVAGTQHWLTALTNIAGVFADANQPVGMSESYRQVKRRINQGLPTLIGLGNHQHAVLVVGYEEIGQRARLRIYDPEELQPQWLMLSLNGWEVSGMSYCGFSRFYIDRGANHNIVNLMAPVRQQMRVR